MLAQIHVIMPIEPNDFPLIIVTPAEGGMVKLFVSSTLAATVARLSEDAISAKSEDAERRARWMKFLDGIKIGFQ